MDGGVMANQGVHFIDVMRYLVGDALAVASSLTTRGVDIEVENMAAALLKFGNGGLGTIEITTAAYPKDFEASLSVVGSKGTAVIGGIAANRLSLFSPDPSQETACSEDFTTVYGFGHLDIFKGITEFLMKKINRQPIDFEDAMGTIRLLHALYRSDETGTWVDVAKGEASRRLGRPDESLSALYRTPAPREADIA
jgi:predicted dehydrogenase